MLAISAISPARNFRTVIILLELELCGILRNSVEIRETEGKFCGKNLGMEMSLFLNGNEWNWGKIM